MKYKVFIPSNCLSATKCYLYNSINRTEVNYTAMFDFLLLNSDCGCGGNF